jgi:regulator of nucleoside diphosphate kinase
MHALPPIIITRQDLDRLQHLIGDGASPALDRLDAELTRAAVVEPQAVPADVVTMNSDVVYEDIDSGVQRTVRIVYPPDADAALGRISVLAPIGSALLGLRVGQAIEWPTPGGMRQVRVVRVEYQPERAGDYEL